MLRVTLSALVAALLFAPTAVAAPPSNDNFAAAQALSGAPVSLTGSNVDATVETGETFGAQTVWYAWTAPATGRYRAETCGSDFDTVLGVFTGATVAMLTTVATDDDSCALSSRVSFDAAAGAVYRIAIGGYDEFEEGTFRLAISQLHPPANDNFADAQPFSGPTVSGTTLDAGREPDEPFEHGDGSVWYTWTAPASGVYRLQTCGSATDAAPMAYAGSSIGSLVPRSPFGWDCSGGRWTVLRVTAGEVLRIAVSVGESGEYGSFTLRIGPEAAPTNDAFSAAQVVSGPRWRNEGVAIAATSEPGEPPHGGAPAARTVWLRWIAPTRDYYFLAFAGNVRIGLYTGTSLTGLTPVAVGDDPDGLPFVSTAGTEYRIAVSWSENEPFPTGGEFILAMFDGGMQITPPALDFAAQPVDTISAPTLVTVRATEGALAVLPAEINVRGSHATDFVTVGDTCETTFEFACTVGVRFAPTAPGPRSAVLVVDPGFPGSYSIPLSGTGSVASVATPPPPATTRPAVPAASARCRLMRNNRRGALVRCTLTRTPSADGTVTGTVRRGRTTRARATARMRSGKATIQLKSRRRLAAGRYSVSLSVAVRGQARLVVARNIRIR